MEDGRWKSERDGGGGVDIHREGLLLFEDSLVRHGNLQSEKGLTIQCFFSCIEDLCSDYRLITLANESGHVGLDHQILLRHSLPIEVAMTHILSMGKAHEAPGSETLRQCELQGHSACGVCRQLRIEESRLVEVLADLYLFHWQRP